MLLIGDRARGASLACGGVGQSWDAEHEISPHAAAQLVAAQFPQLAGADVVPLAAGWDNTVHLVAGAWAFRFPRRAVALPGFLRETALLPALAPALPVPVPVPVWVGRPGNGFPWPFTGSRLLPGVELAAAGLADAARAQLAGQLGELLAVLHDPALAARLGDGLPHDPNARADPAARIARTLPWLEHLCEKGLWAGDRAVDALFADAAPLGPSTARPALVHGDLHVRHVLVDGPSCSGLIDWGDVCLADPSVDLALACAAFDGATRDRLLAAYGSVDGVTELRARVLAVSLSAALAGAAQAQAQHALRDEALRGLARAVA